MEYAEEYTKKEKITRISLFALLGLVLIFCHTTYFRPFISDFGQSPHCYELFGFNGAEYFWHLVFIGFPASAFLISIVMLPLGVKGIKEGRFPPESVKVYKPTVIKTGAVAYLKSGVLIIVPAAILALSIWGYYQVDAMPPIDKQKLDYSLCQN
ncbi:hypothetical protein ND925_04930 [Vibrio diabolicus]|uniref:hypothetical protein n=1 Tax=Vibrio diabolicus TaxID=50719 RepID=UPI00215FB75A|nr:hypothetical protein [Vibrio diabolicus]MCS0382120.1 hypothetical protein [Vibrio diabolicus]